MLTPAALRLLGKCAVHTVIMRCADSQWEAAMELLDGKYAYFDWTMTGTFSGLVATDAGRAVLASC